MIDWAHVGDLKADMGDSFDEIVTVFLQEVDDAMGRLAPSQGWAALAADLHFLKGAALNLGFVAFAAQCSAGETRAASGAEVDLDSLADCFMQSRGEFLAGLGRRAA